MQFQTLLSCTSSLSINSTSGWYLFDCCVVISQGVTHDLEMENDINISTRYHFIVYTYPFYFPIFIIFLSSSSYFLSFVPILFFFLFTVYLPAVWVWVSLLLDNYILILFLADQRYAAAFRSTRVRNVLNSQESRPFRSMDRSRV